MILKLFIHNQVTKLVILLCLIVALLFTIISKSWNETQNVIKHDVINYYAYLPATFKYKDWTLKYVDQKETSEKLIIWTLFTKEGKRVLKTTMGLAFLYLPFFLLAHIISTLLGLDNGGYTPLYSNALILAGIFYFFIGLYYLKKILERYFSEWIVALTLFFLGLGTQWLFYSSAEGVMSHTYSLALIAAFTHYTIKWHENPTYRLSVIIGLLAGLISLIRATNVIVVLLFIFYAVYNLNSFKTKAKFFIKNFHHLVIITVLCILVWIPQFLYWKIATGQWYYYSYQYEVFFWDSPQILNVLFSYRKGLFVYTPIIVFAYIGIIFMRKNQDLVHWKLPIIIFLSLNLYILSSWWCWWYGGSFGNRAFIDSFAVSAIPLAAFIHWLYSKRVLFLFITTLCFFLIFVQIFQSYQFLNHILHHDSMSKKVFWSTFLKLKQPETYWQDLDFIDYDSAKLKFYYNVFESNNIFKQIQHIISDAEEIHPYNKFYLKTNYLQYGALEASQKTTEKAFSGKYSIKLDTISRGGFEITLPHVFKGEKFLIKVKCLTKDQKCILVAGSPLSKFNISSSNFKPINGSEWQTIEQEITIPKELHGINLRLNCYNYGDYPAYFDDLEIIRVQ